MVDRNTRLALYIALWLALGLLLSLLMYSYSGHTMVWPFMLEIVPWVLVLGFMALPVRFICRVMPLNRKRWFQSVVVLVAAAVATAMLWTLGGQMWSSLLAQWDPAFRPRSEVETWWMFVLAVVLYQLVAAVQYLLLAMEESQAVERRALEMKWLARESELRALRTQIDPHFLFNSLNSISALIGRDGAAARRMLLLLADFFRESVRLGAEDLITLEQEFALCRRFLDIEQVRFGSRLSVQVDLADDVRLVRIPSLCLQPLAENAVRHGIAHLVDGGRVRLSAHTRGHLAVIEIENDRDDDHVSPSGTGIGLDNVRRRLEARYGSTATIDASRSPGRFTVRMVLPKERP